MNVVHLFLLDVRRRGVLFGLLTPASDIGVDISRFSFVIHIALAVGVCGRNVSTQANEYAVDFIIRIAIGRR